MAAAAAQEAASLRAAAEAAAVDAAAAYEQLQEDAAAEAEATAERHAAAVAHYTTAAQLAPRRVTHRTELGKALLKQGRRAEALAAFKEALACDVEDINAHLGRMHAEILLRSLRRQERRQLRDEKRCACLATLGLAAVCFVLGTSCCIIPPC